MKKIMLALILAVLMAKNSFCAVTASVQTPHIIASEPFIFEISTDDLNTQNPDLSVLKGLFEVVSSSVSQKSYIINGQSSSKKTWRFGLIAPKAGDAVIPSITLGTEKTDPVSVFISDEAPSSETLQNTVQNNTSQSHRPTYTLSAELQNAPTHPFVQQQLTYVVTLEDDGNLQGDAPYFENTDDFIIKPLAEASVSTSSNGKRFVSFPFALFAQKSGRLKLPDVKFSGVTYQAPDSVNFFDTGFFKIQIPSIFGIQTPVNLSFDGKEIEIYPPASDFSGMWWLPAQKVTLTSNFEKMPQKITEGTPIIRQITLTAEGLTDTQLPELSFDSNDDFRIYPEKPSLTSASNGKTIISKQTTTITYIPQKSGMLTLPEISVFWYNVKTQKMEKAFISDVAIHVSAAVNHTVQNQKSEPEKSNLKNIQNQFSTPNLFYFWIIGSFLCGILLCFLALKIMNRPTIHHEIPKKVSKPHTPKDALKKLRDDVILQAQKAYPKHLITNLEDITEILGDEALKKETTLFLKALYSGDKETSFNAKKFLKIFENAVKKKQKNKKESEPIPPLY